MLQVGVSVQVHLTSHLREYMRALADVCMTRFFCLCLRLRLCLCMCLYLFPLPVSPVVLCVSRTVCVCVCVCHTVFACCTGSEIVALLLHRGACPNEVVPDGGHRLGLHAGYTPLVFACDAGSLMVAQMLLQEGAAPDGQPQGTPLTAPCNHHHPGTKTQGPGSTALRGPTAPNGPTAGSGSGAGAGPVQYGPTPLGAAVLRRCPDIVDRLLVQGADPDLPCTNLCRQAPMTPLELACTMGYPDVVLALVAGGAAVNTTVAGFAPPLMHALAAKSSACVQVRMRCSVCVSLSSQ